MVFKNNWIVVTPGTLIDPVLKLRLSLGRWIPGYGGPISATQDILLYYDPEIRADRLTMPIPEPMRTRQLLLGPILNDWRVFESAKSREIFSLVLNIVREEEETKLLVTAGENGLKVAARLIEKQHIPSLVGMAHEIIRYTFISCLIIPSWENDEGRPGKCTSMGLYVERPLADELAENTDFNFDRSTNGPVLVGSRVLRP